MKCWGSNAYGSLGLGDLIPRGIALDQMGDALPALGLTFGEGLGAVSNVFAGTLHTCVSGTEGGLACFGLNADGEVSVVVQYHIRCTVLTHFLGASCGRRGGG